MKKIVTTALVLIFYLILIEGICRVWIPLKSDALLRASLILQSDRELGWRQKAFLDTHFEKTSVVTDEFGFRLLKDGKPGLSEAEILVLGPSSAFGWGVGYDKTYSNLLQNETSKRVLNAGQIGFGVEQGIRLWEQIKTNKNFRYVIIAYGVNDIDRFRFYGANGLSDEGFFKLPSKSRLSFFESVNIPLAFWSLLTRAVNEARWLWPCPPVKAPELRSQPQLWIKKINLLAESISETGAIPVLLSSAFLFNEKLNEDLSRKSDELYNLSALQSSQGHCSEARSLFLQARQFEQHRIQKDLTAINEGVRSLNAKWKVVEIQNLLNSKADFVDPIHPSELGHQKIARALGAVMLK